MGFLFTKTSMILEAKLRQDSGFRVMGCKRAFETVINIVFIEVVDELFYFLRGSRLWCFPDNESGFAVFSSAADLQVS